MRIGWGALAHVFVAVALSLPIMVAAATVTIAVSMGEDTMLNRSLLVLVSAAFMLVVAWVALLPPVRQVEIATARTLLGVELPDVADPSGRRSRLVGAAWLAILVAFGLLVSLAVLYLLPIGVGLLAQPFSGESEIAWPNRSGVWHTGSGWSAAWLVPIGLAALAALVLLVLLAAHLLVRWSVPVLGPSYAERLALADERERDLARANALAREVHDTLGHTLTAMTVQVTLARRLMARDPAAADEALAVVEEHGRRAQADVDAVVGALRSGADPGPLRPTADPDSLDRLRALVAESPVPVAASLPESLLLDPLARHDLESIVREGLTNAARHGTGTATLCVRTDDHGLLVEVRNSIGRPRSRASGGGQGLAGLRERVLLRDGKIEAGPDDRGEWVLWVLLHRRP